MKSEMLINVSQPEECRIAIVEDGVLEELYIERASADNYVGNIYKGRIVNLEPSIQAAFVDFGVGRNGFLHISDVEPQYFRQGGFEVPDSMGPGRMADIDTGDDEPENDEDGDPDDGGGPRGRGRGGPPATGQARLPRGGRPRFKPPIQDIFRRGDEVLVQVIKEGLGTKGPTLSTYISIPGRYLVLMPALGRVGVSRKIEDDQVRRTLRDTLLELNPPKGLGFIVRTAGQERTKKELSRDMAYLLRLWKVIVRRLKKQPGPCDIYEESDIVIRTIRDIFTQEIDAIYIDEPEAHDRAKEFLQLVMPRHVGRLHLYEGKEPLFHKYKLETEIAQIYQRKVPLRAGGSIVIDQTEALVAIDVNSGNFRADGDAEETAYRLNVSAAKEIARQLRLRDLGGVIVNDFIDMR
ncbi:MAG: Rne/Rng family ribonuclease, partial [Pirellulaceae bacterium]